MKHDKFLGETGEEILPADKPAVEKVKKTDSPGSLFPPFRQLFRREISAPADVSPATEPVSSAAADKLAVEEVAAFDLESAKVLPDKSPVEEPLEVEQLVEEVSAPIAALDSSSAEGDFSEEGEEGEEEVEVVTGQHDLEFIQDDPLAPAYDLERGNLLDKQSPVLP